MKLLPIKHCGRCEFISRHDSEYRCVFSSKKGRFFSKASQLIARGLGHVLFPSWCKLEDAKEGKK